MTRAGLETRIDAAGNLIGSRAGSDGDLPPILFGSHIDSVPQGGNYDGQVGSMGAIEVAQTLGERGLVTRHPLEVVLFTNEENGKTGSRAMSGEVEARELELPTHTELTIGEGLRAVGGDPARLDSVQRGAGDIAAYLELHIEQGGILEERGIAIGVVEGIVGIVRWNVAFQGFANHAGTTPMNGRRDALVAAARFITAVDRVARGMSGRQVATVGRIRAEPGAPNVIPGRVELSLEIRDLEMAKIETVYQAIHREGEGIGRDTETGFEAEQYYVSRAAPTDPRLRDLVTKSAAGLGLSSLPMPSGAGHDAQSIALLAPIGMIFIPSVGGISHSPLELSRPGDIVAGADVLLRTLLGVDAMDL
jgi:N-carbamoyl-L-amino-acid hydrolase